jgi:hypothetical protein
VKNNVAKRIKRMNGRVQRNGSASDMRGDFRRAECQFRGQGVVESHELLP